MSNFLKRFLTSLAILPIVFYSVYIGEIVFVIFVGLVLSIGYWEIEKMLELPKKSLSIFSFVILIILVVLAYMNPQMFLYSSALIFVIWIIRIIYSRATIQTFWNSYLFILLYIGFGINFSILIRNLDNGVVLLAAVLIISSVNDIAAYLFGKFFGANKAFPNISPNKTYEGSIAGIISSILISIFLFDYFKLMIPLPQAMFIGMVISFLGILGDLLESFIKRKSGVKDTGNLLPGHGGILDRIDSLILILPFFYLIVRYLGY